MICNLGKTMGNIEIKKDCLKKKTLFWHKMFF